MRKMGHREQGATIVEAAVVLPIAFMLLLAILEFGRAYNEYQVLTNAAREACRHAVAPNTSGQLPGTAEVQQVATDWLSSANLTPTSPPTVSTVPCGSITINGNTLTQQCTTVTVTAQFNFLAPQLLFGNNGPSVNLSSNATMRQETQ